jgi:hypothetical protein
MIIGLHGAKQSGKDSFYKIISQHYLEYDIRKIAFADPIKKEVCEIFNLSSEKEYDDFKTGNIRYTLPSSTERSVSSRQIVREIGMLMRSYNPKQFTKYVKKEIEKAPNAVIWCITDLRFENELEMIKKFGGCVIKIVREGFVYDGHVTETEIDDNKCSYTIFNNSSYKDYNLVAKEVFEDALKRY